MAKISAINKNNKRIKLSDKLYKKRLSLNSILQNIFKLFYPWMEKNHPWMEKYHPGMESSFVKKKSHL